MGVDQTIGGRETGPVFPGEDRKVRLHVKDRDGNSVDITGWAGRFVVRDTDDSPDPPRLDKALTVEGVFAATNNPQRWTATLTDDEMNLSVRSYRYSAKRTDDGSEKIVKRGDFALSSATQK